MAPTSTVLIVDDNPILREALSAFFKRRNCIPVLATNGEECLSVLHDMEPNLVMMDLEMPKKDGLSTLVELQKRGVTQKVPIVVMTYQVEEHLVTQALKLGAISSIRKPFKLENLEAQLQEYLSGFERSSQQSPSRKAAGSR